jgi:hypothetical protein
MKRIALLLALVLVGLSAASYAAAGPDPGNEHGKGKGKAHAAASCTGKRARLELKGTIVSAGSESFVMTVQKANHHAKSLTATQLTIQLTDQTKIRRKGHAKAADLTAGDRVKVHAWACRSGDGPGTTSITGPIVAQKVDAHPAKTTTTTETTTAESATTAETTTTTP